MSNFDEEHTNRDFYEEDGFDPELVRKLVDKVEVTKDKRVEITFKFADICSLIDEALKGVGS